MRGTVFYGDILMRFKKILLYGALLLNPCIIIYLWYGNAQIRWSNELTNLFSEAGRLAGLFAVYCILLQIILIGRVKWVERIFGLDRLSRVHKWNGYLAGIFILSHPVCLTIGYTRRDYTGIIEQFMQFLTWEDVTAALIGLVLFIAIIITSITIVQRRMKYETWYYVHLILYLAILLAFGHQLVVGNDLAGNAVFATYWKVLYGFVILNLLFFRFFKPLYVFYRHKFLIDRVVRETDDVVSLYIGGKNLHRFRFEPGQFLIVRFLCRSLWRQAHPFSFSAQPDGKYIRISIKNVGDFTSQVLAIPPGTPVIIDGPHGIFTARKCASEKVLLVAGGIGITPLRALIPRLLELKKQVVLLYSNRVAQGIVFKDELEKLSKNSSFIAHLVVTRDPAWQGEKGAIDQEKISRLVPDVKDRDVYLCGPPPMMDTIRKTLRGLSVKPSHIHYEQFSL